MYPRTLLSLTLDLCRLLYFRRPQQLQIECPPSPAGLEKELTCVSCSWVCWPPSRIFQCSEGDVLCEECAGGNRGLPRCPECDADLTRIKAVRNKALEKLARRHYYDH